nr:MAG TPA: hypothetical protein [Caudoviricetes sp.]
MTCGLFCVFWVIGQKIIDGNAETICDFSQHCNIRFSFAILIQAYRRFRNAHQVSELLHGHSSSLAQCTNIISHMLKSPFLLL